MSTDTETRWTHTLRSLSNEPAPPLPAARPGRVHRPPEPLTVAQDAAQQDSELAIAQVWQQLADSEGGSHD